VALGSEFTASGLLMHAGFPGSAVWIWCLLFAAIVLRLNAFSTRLFGETEFWLSLVKVSAIVARSFLEVPPCSGCIPSKPTPPATAVK